MTTEYSIWLNYPFKKATNPTTCLQKSSASLISQVRNDETHNTSLEALLTATTFKHTHVLRPQTRKYRLHYL